MAIAHGASNPIRTISGLLPESNWADASRVKGPWSIGPRSNGVSPVNAVYSVGCNDNVHLFVRVVFAFRTLEGALMSESAFGTVARSGTSAMPSPAATLSSLIHGAG